MSGLSRLAELRREAGADDDDDRSEDERNGVQHGDEEQGGVKSTKRKDREKDKKKKSGKEEESTAASSTELDAQIGRYDAICNGLEVIKKNGGAIERLRAKNKQTSTEKSRKQVMAAMDELMSTTNQYGQAIKKALDEIKKENTQFERQHPNDSSTKQAHENLYQQHLKKFQAAMNEYNQAAAAFKSDLQKRTRREIKIVDQDLTEEEITDIVENGRAQDVIREALVSDNLQDVVRAIEERHQDILRLESQVLEIFELFRDLATLVDLQQESLDVIENRIQHAARYTEKAEVELQQAEDYQKKARNRRCCILMIVVGILLVILFPTLLKTGAV